MTRCVSPGLVPGLVEKRVVLLIDFRAQLRTQALSDPADTELIQKMEHLGLNLLLFLSAFPFEYQPSKITRKLRHEGKRIIPELAQAKFLARFLHQMVVCAEAGSVRS